MAPVTTHRFLSGHLLLATFCLALTACGGDSWGGGGGGGGGGGIPNVLPTIASAAFSGTSSTPTAGDKLLLFMSEDVVLVTGAPLNDLDLTLSNGTLGTVTATPTLPDSRTVQITLGSGVSFTPGTTTIALSASNDAIQDLQGALGVGGTPRTITEGDGDNPTITLFTLNAIDTALNGKGPAGGTLQTPRNGFSINLSWIDATSTIDASATVITADVTVTASGQPLAAGSNLSSAMTLSSSGNTITFTVPSSTLFPTDAVILTARVKDATGMVSPPAIFDFQATNLTDAIRPFETSANAKQVWFIDTSRDIESYTHITSPSTDVIVNSGANGRPDLEDLFLIIGLHGGNSTVNAKVTSRFKEDLEETLDEINDGLPISITFSSQGSFPGSSGFTPYNSLGFSQICLAGASKFDGSEGVLGRAQFDPNNAFQNDNCMTAFGSLSQRLGVFLHALIDMSLPSSSASLFRTTYDPFVPGNTSPGIPIGNAADGLDGSRLDGNTNDARKLQIDRAIERLAKLTAVVVAHECGHSMGLVKDFAMPVGLYGFGGHIDSSAQFPSGSQNIMKPAISFEASQSASTGFNSLNRAYLNETALYHNQ